MRWCGIVRLGSIGDDLIVSSVFPRIKAQGGVDIVVTHIQMLVS